MNVVMDDAAEVYVKDAKPRRELGTSNSSTKKLQILMLFKVVFC